jgi:hypothetical protein
LYHEVLQAVPVAAIPGIQSSMTTVGGLSSSETVRNLFSWAKGGGGSHDPAEQPTQKKRTFPEERPPM